MIPVGGICCCLSAGALYLLSWCCGREIDALKSVTRVARLEDLGVVFWFLSIIYWADAISTAPAQLLEAGSKMLPLLVSVSGSVGSDAPINCEHSGLRGVIVEQMAEQLFLKQNDAGSWTQDSALMLSMCKEVPWYLDDGTARVRVVGARGASGFSLTKGSEVFEESGRSLGRGKLEYLQGLKMLGVKRTERVLPTGMTLTVIGQAVKDDIGTIRIQRSCNGPFYASGETFDQLIVNLGNWSSLYKYASGGFAVFGVYLLAKHAVQCFMERRHHREMRKKVLAAAARKAGQEEGGSNGKCENVPDATSKDRLMPDLCVICLEQEYNSVFVPCGHMCCCVLCASRLTNCPLCRTRIDQAVRAFRH